MSDDSERTQVKFLADKHVKDAAQDKTEHGELSERFRQLMEQIAFGEQVAEHSQLEKHLQQKREERDDLKREKRRIEADIESVDQTITRLEERLANATSLNDRFEAKVEEIEIEHLYQGIPAVPDLPAIERAANEVGKPPEEVVEILRERNPHLPDAAFREQLTDGVRWCGLDENNDPVTQGGRR